MYNELLFSQIEQENKSVDFVSKSVMNDSPSPNETDYARFYGHSYHNCGETDFNAGVETKNWPHSL